MKKENNHKDLLESVKRYVQLSEEKQRIQLITDAFGERRLRDLQDILSQIEQEKGWQEIVSHLSKVHDFQYSLPIGAGPSKSKVEELKFREGIFSLLSCCGLEPVRITTEDLLDCIKTADSFVEASNKARDYLEYIATEQIQSGDSLFFDASVFDTCISNSLIEKIERIQRDQIRDIWIACNNDEYNIHPLWYNEIGRQALAMIGIKGNIINQEQMDMVLSVIHEPVSIEKKRTSTESIIHEPSNRSYRELLESMINHDVTNLCFLASRLSYPIMKVVLEESLDHYIDSPTSENYRNVLIGINAHVRIRTLDSIGFLEWIAQFENPRIATSAITALGNFYHESSVTALVDILCKTKNQNIIKVTKSSILNVSKRCAETGLIIVNAIESNCCNQNKHLKRLRKDIIGKKMDYYM